MITYEVNAAPTKQELTELYDSVGWSIYTKDPVKLEDAVSASLYLVTAHDGNKLVGLARVVGDGFTIIYLQDILVAPDYQRRGLGRELFSRVFEPYENVRQKVLMTDDDPAQLSFYKSMGFKQTGELDSPLNVFVKFD
ncbi:MAG: GNAT family N-acetyltransferase [Microbacteriaceae bacterium]|nr:GNAT family N-acetyltransferase [Microbacteriaceae bacterium]